MILIANLVGMSGPISFFPWAPRLWCQLLLGRSLEDPTCQELPLELVQRLGEIVSTVKFWGVVMGVHDTPTILEEQDHFYGF